MWKERWQKRIQAWWLYSRTYVVVAFVAWGLGLFMGWRQGGHTHRHEHQSISSTNSNKQAIPAKKTVWTCSMHPQFRMPTAGKCPICHMDLIPLVDSDGTQSQTQLAISETTRVLAEIQTQRVQRRPLFLEVRMVGRVAYDETRVKTITSWIPGRLEKMYVDYTGVPVRRGDHLVKIYSPELLSAQQELLQALQALQKAQQDGHNTLVVQTTQMSLKSARRKLELLGLRSWQIANIEKRGTSQERVNIYSPIGGIVITKKALEGMYVTTGSPLYTIADLSQVWVKFDAYERDLPWLHVGQQATFTTLAAPGRVFSGKIVYIDPILNPNTRTVSVRVNVRNPDGFLRPEMFVKGSVHVSLSAQGDARVPDRTGQWVCPMHPEITSSKRKICSICGMSLERVSPKKNNIDDRDPLVIPASAPLLTGKRSVVYVRVPKKPKPTYEGREVTLGSQAGDYYVVLAGLKEGEEVVIHGAFKLDSELQIQARPSMMSATSEHKTPPPPPPIVKPPLPAKFAKSIDKLYHLYFAVSHALSADDAKLARQQLRQFQQNIRNLRLNQGPARLVWERLRSQLFSAIEKALSFQDIATQRLHFAEISKQVLALEKSLGHSGIRPYFVVFCPMAFNNHGASWLQETDAVRNPYFGKQMLVCGTVKESLAGREGQPVASSRRFLGSLSSLYRSYFGLQMALYRDQWPGAKTQVHALQRAITQIRSAWLQGEFRKRWQLIHQGLHAAIQQAHQAKQIEALRRSFEPLSQSMLQVVYILGHVEKHEIFETFCPMAFNNRGAAWLQTQDQTVQNPYFGAKMAHCGSVRRRFVARQPPSSSRTRKRKP